MRADTTLSVSDASADAALAQVRAGTLCEAIVLTACFGDAAGAAPFGSAAKPEFVPHYDPSQAMVLPLVRELLAQHVIKTVSRSVFSGSSPVLGELRVQAPKSDRLPAEQRIELTEMFDSIARVQSRNAASSGASGAASGGASASPAGASGASFSAPFATREVEANSNAETKYNSYAHTVAGMGVQFVLVMGVDIGIGLLTMRRLGLWKRLRAAPLSRATLLGSRIASAALIALIVFAVIYAFAFAVLGVRVDVSAVGFVAALIAFALLAARFGLLISALGRTPEAMRGLAILETLLDRKSVV